MSVIAKYQSLTEQTVEGQNAHVLSQLPGRFQLASWQNADMGFLIMVLVSTLWYIKEISGFSCSSQGRALKKGVSIFKNVPEGKLLLTLAALAVCHHNQPRLQKAGISR